MTQTICAVEVCDRAVRANGYCAAHNKRFQAHGDPGTSRIGRVPYVNVGPCSVNGCEVPAKAAGYCGTHYARWNRTGDPGPAVIANRQRTGTDALFRAGVEGKPGACVLGPNTGRPLTAMGSRTAKRTVLARAVWEAVHGPIPEGLWVLHWCQAETCVNVAHLYLGTPAENTADTRYLYELGRAIVAARVQDGGPGIARGQECSQPPRH